MASNFHGGYRTYRMPIFLLLTFFIALPVTVFALLQQQSITSKAAGTGVSVTVFLHGIGKGGDSANTGSVGNMNPLTKQRIVSVGIFNSQNSIVASKAFVLTYNPTNGNYTGSADFGAVPSGSYTVAVRIDKYLQKVVSGIQVITSGQANQILPVTLIAGDMVVNNKIDIQDYNALMNCYSDLVPPKACTAQQKSLTDITDDGFVNQLDYNLFIREISNRSGEANPPTVPTSKISAQPTAVAQLSPTKAPTANPITTPTAVPQHGSTVPVGSKVVFVGDYNTGNFSQWDACQLKGVHISSGSCAPTGNYSASLVNDGAGHTTAMRYELRANEVGNGQRAEVLQDDAASVVEGDERWYEWSMKFDQSFQNPNGVWFIVMQWHSGSGSPPLAINISNSGNVEIGGDGVAKQKKTIGPVRKGQWVKYVLHVKFSRNASVGYVEAWENGVKTVQKYNSPTMSSGENYLKQGIYRDTSNKSTSIVYHDDLRVTAP